MSRLRLLGLLFALVLALPLQAREAAPLAAVFQVRPDNPLVGLEGRAALLRRLGAVMAAQPERFGDDGRPGGLFDRLAARARQRSSTAPARRSKLRPRTGLRTGGTTRSRRTSSRASLSLVPSMPCSRSSTGCRCRPMLLEPPRLSSSWCIVSSAWISRSLNHTPGAAGSAPRRSSRPVPAKR